MPPQGPRAADLDAVVPDRPVILFDDSYHASWLNSAGLRLAGIDAGTRPTPTTASSSGWPTARRRARCAKARARWPSAPSRPTRSSRAREGILHFQRDVAGPLGLTTAHDANLRPGRDAALEAYERLQDDGLLTARYCISLWIMEDEPLEEQIEAAVAERARHTGPLVTAAWAKLFADGVIEGHTGVLKEPYADRPGFCGEPVWPPEALHRGLGRRRAGRLPPALPRHRRRRGRHEPRRDRGRAGAPCPGRTSRALITHLQYVDLADLARFAELGVVAVPQPFWFEKDELYRERQLPYLGGNAPTASTRCAASGSTACVAASASDYPVPPGPDPLVAIQRGVLRRDLADAAEPEPLWPEEPSTSRRWSRASPRTAPSPWRSSTRPGRSSRARRPTWSCSAATS